MQTLGHAVLLTALLYAGMSHAQIMPDEVFLCEPFAAMMTDGATRDTIPCHVTLLDGTAYTFTMCGSGGYNDGGDSFLMLYDAFGEVQKEDAGCAYAVLMTYTTTGVAGSGVSRPYTINQGCGGDGSCSGRVAVYVTGSSIPPEPCPPPSGTSVQLFSANGACEGWRSNAYACEATILA